MTLPVTWRVRASVPVRVTDSLAAALNTVSVNGTLDFQGCPLGAPETPASGNTKTTPAISPTAPMPTPRRILMTCSSPSGCWSRRWGATSVPDRWTAPRQSGYRSNVPANRPRTPLLSPFAGSRHGPRRGMPSMLADREHARGADLCCSSPLEDRGSATTICVHAQYGGYARQRVMRSSQAMARCMADRHGGSHGRCPGSRDCPPADDTFALPRYRGDMAAVRPIMTGDEWAAAHSSPVMIGRTAAMSPRYRGRAKVSSAGGQSRDPGQRPWLPPCRSAMHRAIAWEDLITRCRA